MTKPPPRGLSKEAAAEYAGAESLSTFSDWIRRGIMPGAIPGTHIWDRKALNLICQKPLDPDLFPDGQARYGQIYFVTNGEDTKIGYTRKWRSRLATLQTGSAKKLIPLILFYANEDQESKLHRRFDDIRLSGEWFAHGPLIMKTVRLIRSMGMDCLS